MVFEGKEWRAIPLFNSQSDQIKIVMGLDRWGLEDCS